MLSLFDNFVVFDLETKKSFDDVGGQHNKHLLEVSVGVVYDSETDLTTAYREDQMNELVAHLQRADLVVGFNQIGFDYPVLQPYTEVNLRNLSTVDIMYDLANRLGHRVSLDSVAQGTLNAEKSADGLLAIKWYREGEWDKLISYCEKDVLITKDIYLFGKENGFVKFYDRFKSQVRQVRVEW